MIWLLFGLMLLAAALVVTWPMYRRQKRVSAALVSSVAIILGVSALVYSGVGTPVPPPAAASIDEMVAALDNRLQDNPDDLEGWKMLGRSYMQLQNYPRAIAAFERAVALEKPASAQTMASLGEALLIQEGSPGSSRVGQLFESALAAEPSNPKALFYGGIIAIERGNRELAADRWEALLALSPPPEIQDVLRQRVAEWRGEAQPAAQPEAPTAQSGAAGPAEAAIAVNVSLGPGAAAAVARTATVFVIARDPAQPSPPIAAVRRTVADLPALVSLSNADAMLPGRLLSQFERLEIVARVSGSGGPIAQSGDWYGEYTLSNPGSGETIDVVIDKQLP
ncbi:MAG TPA: tetratricopeptide repeat protein [Woeseiaceae bacterium]